MNKTQFEEIRQRCDAATPGGWSYDGMHNEIHCAAPNEDYFLIISELRTHPGEKLLDEFGHQYNANFEFIAHARQDVPALLDHIDKLEAELLACKGR